ncbi:amidohydrolase family protein [Mucilaginibacter rubeus]|uniref:Amidohydrolase family protein n=1 Tax=Mucilaginibacter rubeus TaxID=2027860 RepID=A0A5C1I6M5_9SPHI|nr:amidohydrolase family protein [Mucilaginibacter rubeus]QEM13523.1 amidohydrolase family protein [Mucilaginibacter rubeus]
MKHYSQRAAALIFFLVLAVNLKAQVKPNYYTDYHVHLQDSATVQLGYRMLKAFHLKATKMDSLCFDADTIIGRLDKAKFHSAWIISNAYWFGSPATPVKNEYLEVKKQNDWIAAQAAQYPDRLKAFMSINPLKPYAIKEIERCAVTKRFTGLKLHFANSKVNLFDKAQVKQLQKVFAVANKYKLLLLVHFRNSEKWEGAANTKILLKQILPFAKNTKVVIAHMAGWGGYDRQSDKALRLISAYLHSNKEPGSNLFLDVSAVFPLDENSNHTKSVKRNTTWHQLIALKKQIKKIGTDHIVFGTDWPLIDIGPYIEMLNKNLGEQTTRQILNTRVIAD